MFRCALKLIVQTKYDTSLINKKWNLKRITVEALHYSYWSAIGYVGPLCHPFSRMKGLLNANQYMKFI